MAYLSRLRKDELRLICEELGEENISENVKIPELKRIILESENFDEDLVQGISENLLEDRKNKQKLELEERKRQHELEMRRLELAARASDSVDSAVQRNLTASTPKVDWQTQIPKFDLQNNDISLFLVHFERVMKRVQMPESLWTSCLINLLPSEIVRMIMREPEEQAENFQYIKTLLLSRYKLSPERLRQMFYSHRINNEKSWREFYHELETYFNGWITGLEINTFNDLKDLIITDQMKRKTPYEIREHYLDQWTKITSPIELAEKIDEFIALWDVVKRKTVFSTSVPDKGGKAKVPKVETPVKKEVTGRQPAGLNTCYNCYDKGHFSRDCPKPKRQKYCTKCKKEGHGTKDCTEGITKSPSSLRITNVELPHRQYKPITIDGMSQIPCIIDTGSSVSLIKLKLACNLNKIIEAEQPEHLKGIGGNLTPCGVVLCNIVVDNIELNSIRFLVVPDNTFSGPDILIGTNVIDCSNIAMVRRHGQSVLINDSCDFLQNFKLESNYISKATLKSKKTVVIEPRSIQLVDSMTDDGNLNSFIIEAQNHQCNEIYVKNGETCVPVMNCTDNQIRIEENQVILRGNAIPAVEVKDNEEDAPREISKGENESPRDDLKLDESLHVQLESNEQVIRAPLTPSQIRVGPQVMESEVQQLCDLLNEFRDCIAVKTDELGCMKTTPMEIMEVPGSKPVSHAPYRASYHEREVLRKIISELKRQGVIQDSNSEYSSPVLLVKKKTGDYRMVIDYRRLNAQTLKDKFPLPCIDDLLDKLNGYNLFCVLDAAQGFNQIPLHTESMRKAAFVTPDGHYEPTRLFFGLTNGPAVFQRAMVMALGDLLWNVVTCFVDDMLIGAKTFDEMMTRLRSVLMKLREAGVTLKISKCDFAMKEIEYLGFLISSKGVQPGPRKLAAVSEFPTPKNVRELRRFLGLTSFFRRFIERYALLASPLTQLLKKEAVFKWTTEHQKVFDELKRRLVSKPVLKLYDHHDITELHTDASSEGLAGMLLQYDKDNKLRLVYCVSRRTSPDEAMYHSSRLELIAAVWSMTRLRPLLIGKHFTLVTDCSAITFLNNQKNLKPQIARWAELLSEFDYEVKHRAGDKMCHVDALSRAPVEERNCTPDQEFDLTSPIELTDTPTAFYVYTENDRVALLQAQDKDLQNILQATRKPLGSRNQNERHLANQYCIENGILYRLMKDRGKTKKLFVMPKSMRKYLAVRYHDFSGHFGVDKVRQLIQEKFWFPNMTSYLKLHIRQCVSCAFIKVPAGKVQGKLNPIPPGRRPFEIIHIDFLGPLQKSSNRNSEVFVIIDNLTKFVRLRACKSCTTANVIKFLDEFVKDFGIPLRIISDRGTCFTSKAFVDFCKEKKLKHTLICSQRPQANGQVERINRILIPQIIASCKKENQKDWDKVLLDIQRQINWSPSKSTGKSPFELLYGYVPEQSNDFPVDLLPEEAIYNEPQTLQNEARHMISKSQTEMKKHYDRRHCPAIKYEIGDVVLVKRLPEQTGNSTKLQVRYRGPLVIDSVLPSDTYRLSDLRSVGQGRKRRANYVTTAHASQIKLFKLMDEDEQLSDLSDSDDDQQLDTKSDGGPSTNRMADCKQLQTCTCLPVPADEYRSAPPLNNNNKKK